MTWSSCIWLLCTPLLMCFWTRCEQIVWEIMERQAFVEHTQSMDIKWYWLWAIWPNYYDCSGIPYDYYRDVTRRKKNTWLFWKEWQRTDEPVFWDIVAMLNRGTWANHTAIYIWQTDEWLWILDGYPWYRWNPKIRLHNWYGNYKLKFVKNPYLEMKRNQLWLWLSSF